MKKIAIIFTILAMVLLACQNREKNSVADFKDQAVPSQILPEIKTSSQSAITETVSDFLPNSAFIPIDSAFNVISVLNTNLDIDSSDEQIIALKKKDDPNDTIYIYVVKYDDVRNSYMLNWEGESFAKNVRTFSMRVLDVTGDHLVEICISGTDHQGRQTLDIFQKVIASQGFGLSYRLIAQFGINGTIDIDATERSEAYRFLQKTGASFPLTTLYTDPESETGRDLIKETYLWNHQKNSYVAIGTEKIKATTVHEKELDALFLGNTKDFENFLSGPWYKVDAVETLINFSPQNSQIIFYSGGGQELYKWNSSRKTIYKGIAIVGINQAISAINFTINVTVNSMVEIDVRIRSFRFRNEFSLPWEGRYYRLTENLQRDVIASKRHSIDIDSLKLNGLYTASDGKEYVFTAPRFTERESNIERGGGYVVYELDRQVIEFRYIDDNGLTSGREVYAIEYSEESQNEEIKRTLILHPAKVRYNAVDILDESPKELVQREQKEISE
jgi:hypothetical protein